MASKQREVTYYGVYSKSVLEKKIVLNITEIGENIKKVLEEKLISTFENKCIPEGFIKPNSIRIISHSSGIINTDVIEFTVIFECKVCFPIENQLIDCTSKTITKAGIHAEVKENDIVPIQVFIAKDHHMINDYYFSTIKENMKIRIKVIGVRYELNDPYICVIGKLMNIDNETNQKNIIKIKPNKKIIIKK